MDAQCVALDTQGVAAGPCCFGLPDLPHDHHSNQSALTGKRCTSESDHARSAQSILCHTSRFSVIRGRGQECKSTARNNRAQHAVMTLRGPKGDNGLVCSLSPYWVRTRDECTKRTGLSAVGGMGGVEGGTQRKSGSTSTSTSRSRLRQRHSRAWPSPFAASHRRLRRHLHHGPRAPLAAVGRPCSHGLLFARRPRGLRLGLRHGGRRKSHSIRANSTSFWQLERGFCRSSWVGALGAPARRCFNRGINATNREIDAQGALVRG